MTMTEVEREAFLKERMTGIGGSDAAAICGLDPYKTPLQVWAEKTGKIPSAEQNEAMWRGIMLEPVVIAMYRLTTGVPVKQVPMLRHKDNEFMVAHLDGLIPPNNHDPEPGVLEAKTANSRMARLWDDPDAPGDRIPQQYMVQVQHNMAVADLPYADVPVLMADEHQLQFMAKLVESFAGRGIDPYVEEIIGNNVFALASYLAPESRKVYRVERDDDLIKHLIELEQDFWDDHVLKDFPPDPSGHEADLKTLLKMYPEDTGEIIESTPDIDHLAGELREVKENKELFVQMEARLKAQLLMLVGEAAGVEGDWGKVIAKWTKPRKNIDWKAIAEELGANPVLIEKHTTVKDGSRPFRTYWKD